MPIQPRSDRCVILFARSPRLEARLKGVAFASPLFERTGERIAAAVAQLSGIDLLVASPGGAVPGGLRTSSLPAARRLSQRGTGFGERLQNAFADARQLGYRRIVAIGIDAPGVGVRQIAAAFGSLDRHEVVLGAAADGGVYLIGSREDPAALFAGVPWRTAAVCRRLQANAPDAVLLADQLIDVDAAGDVRALRRDRSLDAATREMLETLTRQRFGPRETGAAPLPLRLLLPRLPLRAPPAALATTAS